VGAHLGEILPATHFLRIIRGIMLKGNGWYQVAGEIWPMGVFILAVGIALLRFRRTLD
jgi:ABC-2 type transport system permease protein